MYIFCFFKYIQYVNTFRVTRAHCQWQMTISFFHNFLKLTLLELKFELISLQGLWSLHQNDNDTDNSKHQEHFLIVSVTTRILSEIFKILSILLVVRQKYFQGANYCQTSNISHTSLLMNDKDFIWRILNKS